MLEIDHEACLKGGSQSPPAASAEWAMIIGFMCARACFPMQKCVGNNSRMFPTCLEHICVFLEDAN